MDWEMRVFLIDRYMLHWSVLPLSRVWHTFEYNGVYKRAPKDVVKNTSNDNNWEDTYKKLRLDQALGNDR